MTHDEWRLLGYGVVAAALIGLVLTPILLHNRNFPAPVGQAICGVIALAVFGLSRYMGRKKVD